jgi:SAM-dependent methyltransferase
MKKAELWKDEKLSKRYLEIVRAAIPLAKVQTEVLLTLIRKMRKKVASFLDLGCGDGHLGWEVLAEHPGAKGVFLDFSETMIKAARKKAPRSSKKLFFIQEDYGKSSWTRSVAGHGRFDLVISGLSIHHQTDRKKKEIYRQIYDLLVPGGLFLNLEHVQSATPELQKIFSEYFIDSLYSRLRRLDRCITREKVSRGFYNNQLLDTNILAPVEKQCRWLREIGFRQVDCFFKIFELSIFGGVKPH